MVFAPFLDIFAVLGGRFSEYKGTPFGSCVFIVNVFLAFSPRYLTVIWLLDLRQSPFTYFVENKQWHCVLGWQCGPNWSGRRLTWLTSLSPRRYRAPTRLWLRQPLALLLFCFAHLALHLEFQCLIYSSASKLASELASALVLSLWALNKIWVPQAFGTQQTSYQTAGASRCIHIAVLMLIPGFWGYPLSHSWTGKALT